MSAKPKPAEQPPPERRRSDRRRTPPSLAEVLEFADRRHRERRQYAEQPSGWADLDQGRKK